MRLADRVRRAAGAPSTVVPYVLVDRRRLGTFPRLRAAFANAGVPAVELGFPFSDPIADGPVLEAASDRALRAGTRWTDLLRAARGFAGSVAPVVMTYANPLWNRGLAASFAALARAGVCGVIVPDLTVEDARPWTTAARAARIDLVLLVAPGLDRRRVESIARRSRGYLYLVSRYGTTGAGHPAERTELRRLVGWVRAVRPDLPILVGFGVHDRASARRAVATGADGVIVGTAVEERLAEGVPPAAIARWLTSLRVAA